jgi:hypothetical protein
MEERVARVGCRVLELDGESVIVCVPCNEEICVTGFGWFAVLQGSLDCFGFIITATSPWHRVRSPKWIPSSAFPFYAMRSHTEHEQPFVFIAFHGALESPQDFPQLGALQSYINPKEPILQLGTLSVVILNVLCLLNKIVHQSVERSHDMHPVKISRSWFECAKSIQTFDTPSGVPVISAAGSKGQGKSTFLRYVSNCFLNE